jgi:hypothetical protein
VKALDEQEARRNKEKNYITTVVWNELEWREPEHAELFIRSLFITWKRKEDERVHIP